MADIVQKLKIGALATGAALFVVACGSQPAEAPAEEADVVDVIPADEAVIDEVATEAAEDAAAIDETEGAPEAEEVAAE